MYSSVLYLFITEAILSYFYKQRMSKSLYTYTVDNGMADMV